MNAVEINKNPEKYCFRDGSPLEVAFVTINNDTKEKKEFYASDFPPQFECPLMVAKKFPSGQIVNHKVDNNGIWYKGKESHYDVILRKDYKENK